MPWRQGWGWPMLGWPEDEKQGLELWVRGWTIECGVGFSLFWCLSLFVKPVPKNVSGVVLLRRLNLRLVRRKQHQCLLKSSGIICSAPLQLKDAQASGLELALVCLLIRNSSRKWCAGLMSLSRPLGTNTPLHPTYLQPFQTDTQE